MGLKEFKEAEGFICFLSCHCSCITDTDGPSGQPGILRFPSKSSSISNRELARCLNRGAQSQHPQDAVHRSPAEVFSRAILMEISHIYTLFFIIILLLRHSSTASLHCHAQQNPYIVKQAARLVTGVRKIKISNPHSHKGRHSLNICTY